VDGSYELSELASPAIDYPAVRARVLDESLAAGGVLLVGESSTAKELMAAGPDRFVLDGTAPESGIADVLALSLDREVLDRACIAATQWGRTAIWALVEPVAGETEPVAEVRAALRSSNLVLVGLRRIFWPSGGLAPRSRTRRIQEETRELLVRVVAADSGDPSLLLEEELVRLERELSVANELRIEQQTARATIERRMAERLSKHRDVEADRERLEAEVVGLQEQVSRLSQQLQDAGREIEALRHRSSRRFRLSRIHRT
jgi:hypothetical protein